MLLRSTYSAGYRARAEVGDKVSVEDVGGAGVAGQGLAYDLAHQPQLRPLGVLGSAPHESVLMLMECSNTLTGPCLG